MNWRDVSMKLMEYVRNNKTYIIAEMSGNHGGNLENALELVRKAKEAGSRLLENPGIFCRVIDT